MRKGKEVGTSAAPGELEACAAPGRQPWHVLELQRPTKGALCAKPEKRKSWSRRSGVGSVSLAAMRGWFEAAEFMITVLEARRPKPRCQQGRVPAGGARAGSAPASLLLLAASGVLS